MELGSNGSGASANGEIWDVVSDQSIRLASAYTLRGKPIREHATIKESRSPRYIRDPQSWRLHLPAQRPHQPDAYRTPGPDRMESEAPGTARTIAAIFTHMHNIRCKWIRLTAPHLKVPPQLNRLQCTPKQAGAALAKSAAGCAEMLEQALGGDSRIEKFHRDGWARPWQAGIEMLCYMLSHEGHHRGQVCMLRISLGSRSQKR